jgi:hypothetical protein
VECVCALLSLRLGGRRSPADTILGSVLGARSFWGRLASGGRR